MRVAKKILRAWMSERGVGLVGLGSFARADRKVDRRWRRSHLRRTPMTPGFRFGRWDPDRPLKPVTTTP
jgi:hypothetical protein